MVEKLLFLDPFTIDEEEVVVGYLWKSPVVGTELSLSLLSQLSALSCLTSKLSTDSISMTSEDVGLTLCPSEVDFSSDMTDSGVSTLGIVNSKRYSGTDLSNSIEHSDTRRCKQKERSSR